MVIRKCPIHSRLKGPWKNGSSPLKNYFFSGFQTGLWWSYNTHDVWTATKSINHRNDYPLREGRAPIHTINHWSRDRTAIPSKKCPVDLSPFPGSPLRSSISLISLLSKTKTEKKGWTCSSQQLQQSPSECKARHSQKASMRTTTSSTVACLHETQHSFWLRTKYSSHSMQSSLAGWCKDSIFRWTRSQLAQSYFKNITRTWNAVLNFCFPMKLN